MIILIKSLILLCENSICNHRNYKFDTRHRRGCVTTSPHYAFSTFERNTLSALFASSLHMVDLDKIFGMLHPRLSGA